MNVNLNTTSGSRYLLNGSRNLDVNRRNCCQLIVRLTTDRFMFITVSFHLSNTMVLTRATQRRAGVNDSWPFWSLCLGQPLMLTVGLNEATALLPQEYAGGWKDERNCCLQTICTSLRLIWHCWLKDKYGICLWLIKRGLWLSSRNTAKS